MILHSQIIGTGTPFVILHGFLGMSDNWKSLGKRFAAQGYQMHLIDQRNHGRSFHDPVFSYQAMAADLLLYCEHHNLDQVVLLGHSMGGKTAMEFAVTNPERVTKLIIADIAPRHYDEHHQDVLKGLGLLDLSIINSRAKADQVLANYIKEPGLRLFLLKNLYWIEKKQLALRVNLPVVTKEISQVGKALAITAVFDKETLFVRGDNSSYITSLDETSIQKQFPKSQIKTVSNAGHWLHAENPEQFHQIVVDFL
jgi:pimeloyl-ACP methyl ester carboxylesterase